jgi:hypothetical protein
VAGVGVGVGEIRAGALVIKGVFSHHFPGGKDELVAAVVDGAASTSPAISAANVAFDRWRVILGERLGGDDMGALVVAKRWPTPDLSAEVASLPGLGSSLWVTHPTLPGAATT